MSEILQPSNVKMFALCIELDDYRREGAFHFVSQFVIQDVRAKQAKYAVQWSGPRLTVGDRSSDSKASHCESNHGEQPSSAELDSNSSVTTALIANQVQPQRIERNFAARVRAKSRQAW